MKYFILIILLIPLLTHGQPLNQTDSLGRKQGAWQKKYPNGRLMYEGFFTNDKPSGQWKRYHDSGALKAVLQYNENSDSVRAKLYENSAQPVAEGSFLGEKKTGLWTYYSEGIKIAGENFSEGLKNGICRKYYLSGELLEESEWKNNLREGKYTAFFMSGQPYLRCIYSSGMRHGKCFSYYPSGSPEVESYYTNDLPEGTWTYFDQNGNPRYTLQYERGILKNPEVLLKLGTEEFDRLEKQRSQLSDPEKYLLNPEEYPVRRP